MPHVNKKGGLISPTHFAVLCKDKSYWCIREFRNDKVELQLVWTGQLTTQHTSSFRDTWPLFTLKVWNFNERGVAVKDPVMSGKTFAYEEEAIKAYEEFLANWTECHVTEDGKFEEVGNHLTPPPPPDPDKPESKVKDLPPDFAAW